MTELSASRKADRFAMALAVARLADEYGLAATLYPETPRSRRASTEVRGPHGLKLTVKFDGSGPDPDTYVLSWHGVEDGTRLAPYKFGPRVNPFHGHKATDVAHGFADLRNLLSRRFAASADGSAFIAEESR